MGYYATIMEWTIEKARINPAKKEELATPAETIVLKGGDGL
ncbi:hypothetical protein [Caminibacter sp.]